MPPGARQQTQARPDSRWPRVERHVARGCARDRVTGPDLNGATSRLAGESSSSASAAYSCLAGRKRGTSPGDRSSRNEQTPVPGTGSPAVPRRRPRQLPARAGPWPALSVAAPAAGAG